jgi:undecaprenyl-diphosphatase
MTAIHSNPSERRRGGAASSHRHVAEHRTKRRNELRQWPLRRPQLVYLGKAWLVITPITTAIGLLIIHVLDDGAFGRGDLRVSEWFADRRTPRLEDMGQIGAGIADTLTVVPICAVLTIAFAIAWKRWLEPAMVVIPVIFEKLVFLPATLLAARDRPPVGQLDGNPPSTSYFSGHTAAAVALYFGLFVVITWHTRSRAIHVIAAVLATAAVVIVGASRLLLGMHYLSDVVVGAIVGAVSVLVVRHALCALPRDRHYVGDTAKPMASSTP